MKRSFEYTLMVLLAILFISCENDEATKGRISFSFHTSGLDNGRMKVDDPAKLLITIKNSDGETVHDRKELTLYEFTGEYLSEPMVLKTGDYQLTEFIILTEADDVLYLTPIEGSDLAYLVGDPLPIDFSVLTDQVTNVDPDVIEAEGFSAAEFGYATFAFDFVDIIRFHTAAYAYNTTSHEMELTDYNLEVEAEGNTLWSDVMPVDTAKVRVHGGYETYSLTFTKTGYVPQTMTLTLAEILAYHALNPLSVEFMDEGLTTGLVAHYTFADGLADDLSGNGNDGVLSSVVATADKAGRPLESMSFDTDADYIKVSAPSFLSNNEGTFAAWVKFDDLGHTQYVGSVGDEGSIESYISFLRIDGTDHTVGVYEREPGLANWVKGSTALNTGVYYHLALVSDGASWKIYIDGEEETLSIVSGANNGKWISDLSSIDNFVIGSAIIQAPYTIPYLDGNVDEVRLYNKALSEAEIQELFLLTQ